MSRSHEDNVGRRRWTVRLAAVCECVGVLLAAIAIQRAVLTALGIPTWKGARAGMLESGAVDFALLARLAAIDQILKYGALLGLALAIGWWHRRRPLERYGVTLGRRRWPELLRVGVVLWGVSAVLPRVLLALDDHLPWLGRGPDHWALFPPAWSAGFLLYMAVGSFLLVPIVEELAFRGYMLTRLREDYGDAGALVLAAVLFALVHTQYFKPEILSVGMALSLVIGSLATGYVLIRTGSLVPCVAAHALGNLPIPPGRWAEEAVAALAVVVLLAAARPVLRWVRDFATLLRTHPAWGGTLFGLAALLAALAAVLALRSHVPALAAGLLGLGVAGNALDRHRARAQAGA